jgi:histidinol phosphatase-like enzyme (inositol monophosphatase family)
MTVDSVADQLRVAAEIVERAGPIALRWFRTPLDIANKAAAGAFDPVTRADHEVEAFLRDALQRAFPEHRILGEEAGTGGGSGPLRWVIDPIDGTRAFVSGNPLWGIMVGLDDGTRALGGIVHVPHLGETFVGSRTAAFLRCRGRETELRTRAVPRLDEAILYCTHPETLADADHRRVFEQLAARCRMLRYGGDCYSYCLLALGHVDLVVEGSLQPYDVIPVLPIVKGAGGVMTNWQGDAAEDGGFVVAAGSPALHREALAILAAL